MIETQIPAQGFEIISERVISILCKEFAYQYSKFKNVTARDVKFWRDRITPITDAEGSVITIGLWKGDYGNESSVGYSEGVYQYVLGFFTSSDSTNNSPGDKLAHDKLHRLMGLARYILKHSSYIRLDFDPPFVKRVEVKTFQVYRPENPQAEGTLSASAHMILQVTAMETTDPVAGIPLTGALTDVKLDETEIGFQYEYEAA